jgi:hypothetical protein
MAANTLTQLTTANTFQHWLTATQSLIGTANLLTNGAGSTFYANTRLEIGGANATLNVVTSATVNDLIGNTANIISVQARNLNLTENVTSTLKTSGQALVGSDLTVYGNSTVVGNMGISGDLTVSGNITLDAIGFDDLIVSGSGSFANTLTVTGNTTMSNATVANTLTANIATITTATITGATITSANISTTTGTIASANITSANITSTNVTTANVDTLIGTANTAIYAAIAIASNVSTDGSVALAIALG